MEDTKKLIKAFSVSGNGGGISKLVTPTIVGDHNNRVTDYTAIIIQEVTNEREKRTDSVHNRNDTES